MVVRDHADRFLMLRPTIEVPDFSTITAEHIDTIEKDATDAMRQAALGVKSAWRDQIRSVGLGNRLANTVRAITYPRSGRSINPAAYIYTKAPKIIDAFSRGPIIRPVNGARYIWIPTANVPRKPGRGRGKMTPEEVDSHFNSEFVFKAIPGGGLQAFIEVVPGRVRGYRRATKGRLAQGRKKELVLMFNLRRTVRMPRPLDLDRLAQEGAAEFVREFTWRLER